jgi:pimeloyl-ACP methyl ester carboxylesterase
MGDSYVDVGDVTLFVRELGERGNKPSLVVIHGGPDVGHGYLLPGFEPLARDHHIVLFDFRGCGRSTRGLPDDELQPEYVVQDTHRLIDKLGLGQVDLLGFSTGGRAAMQFVDKHPDQVRRLILASTTAYTDTAQYLAGWTEYERRQRAEDAANGALRNSTIFVWDLDLAPAYLQLLHDLGDDIGDWSEERAINGLMHPWCTGDPEQILRDCGNPILILHGEKDMGFPVQLAHRLHAAVPTSHLVVIPETAHMCHFERPEVWSNHIRQFLDAHKSVTPSARNSRAAQPRRG